MSKKYNKSVFIFTRDLRLNDNTTLMHLLENSETVIPIFIFNPDQIINNDYKSENSVRFMCESLDELDDELRNRKSRLVYFLNDPEKVINNLLKSDDQIKCVGMNKDYSPFATKRSNKILKICNEYNVDYVSLDDYLLTGTDGSVTKDDGTIYVKFTPFYKAAKKVKVNKPSVNKYKNYMNSRNKLDNEYNKNIHDLYETDKDYKPYVIGGRSNALKILDTLNKFNHYNISRDVPIEETTHLSAYLKFNVVSIREVYYAFKKKLSGNNKLFVQLVWRDFYMLIMKHYPHVIGHPMREKYDIKWDTNTAAFNKWKTGNTGIPIVDAGMRQLNTTGWMHNRVRMIVADFLIKILHIDWRLGEKYFAQNLVDYDIALNNGNWQFIASTGTDSQPYFRIFNPWRQIEKFDNECEYIKKWIPELANIDDKIIRNWNTEYDNDHDTKYVKPIVINIREEAEKSIKLYKKYV